MSAPIEAIQSLKMPLSESWAPVAPGTMPPADLTVIVWDSTCAEPCAVFFDPGLDCWILRSDPTTIHKGAITHWRHCHAPDGIGGEGGAVMSAAIDLTAAAAQTPGIIVRAPYSQAYIPFAEVEDHIIMRSKQMAAILAVIPTGRYSAQMISLVGQMADNLVVEVRRADGGSPLAGQLASQLSELLLMIQGEQGPCDLLWLCQQIANELDEVIPAAAETGDEQ